MTLNEEQAKTPREGLQNSGLCWVLKAFQQGGIFFLPHLL
jgi:hypothetical protein